MVRSVATERSKAFGRVSREALRLAAGADARMHVSSAPDGAALPEEAGWRMDPRLDRLRLLVLELDALVPLERDPERGVLEVLVAEISSHSGHAWISVENAVGRREQVTTFGCGRANAAYFDSWSRCREESVPADGIWDEGRKVRRIVLYDGRPSLVDAGAVAVCDILGAAGIEVVSTCEGHPWGAYVCFRDPVDRAASAAFLEAGWRVERNRPEAVARMSVPRDVADRDRMWRATCETMAAALAPAAEGPSAG